MIGARTVAEFRSMVPLSMRRVTSAGSMPVGAVTPLLIAMAAGVIVQVACATPEGPAQAPVAMPSVELSQPVAEVGGPIDLTYRFVVAEDAPEFDDDYWAFVHVVDADGELMWTDDHQPPLSTRQWAAGSTQQYTRTMFIPRFAATGDAHIEMGLYSPTTGTRLPLVGDAQGMQSYRVGVLTLVLGDIVQIAFSRGWHDVEVSEDALGVEWQWSMQDATLSFRNPGRDAEFFVQLDQPTLGLEAPQQVEVRIGPLVIDSFPLVPGSSEIRRVTITVEQFGAGDDVDLTISVDPTFVPAALRELSSADSRELGVRVFRAFVRPL